MRIKLSLIASWKATKSRCSRNQRKRRSDRSIRDWKKCSSGCWLSSQSSYLSSYSSDFIETSYFLTLFLETVRLLLIIFSRILQNILIQKKNKPPKKTYPNFYSKNASKFIHFWEKCKGTRFKIRATYIKWKISKVTSLQYRKKKSAIRARLLIAPGSLSFSPFLEGLLQTSTDKNFSSYIRQSAWLKIYCPHFPRICTLKV